MAPLKEEEAPIGISKAAITEEVIAPRTEREVNEVVPVVTKEEELQKIKKELSQDMSKVEDLINNNEYSLALEKLNNIKDIATSHNLKNFMSKTEEKIEECKILEFKKRKEEEEKRIKKELSQDMSKVEDLINNNEYSLALEKLNNIKDIATSHNLKNFMSKTEEKIEECKILEFKKRKEEEEKRIKKELQLKMAEIDSLIKEKKLKGAIKILNKIKKKAKDYNLIELLKETKTKIFQCKELELEIKREKEQSRIKIKLEKRLSNIEKLIEDYELNKALENLIEIKQIAKTNGIIDLLKIIKDRINYCKSVEIDTINRVKNTILDYGMKLARLELVDISEKSGIKDEHLIESVILEMIKSKEINAEYFSSSKAIAFYQQEKEVVPLSKPEELKQLRVFLSYATLDAEYFQISDIVKGLEIYPEIKKVSYWEADSKQNIVEFMEDTLKNTDVFVLFCSKNASASNAVKDEWQAAFQMRKKGLLKMVPVYEDEENIPVLLWQLLNVQFTRDNFEGFIQKLYEEILR